jgi:DNA modification methylase
MNIAYNCDCMEYMRTLPDKAFDLAVVDPPYGDGLHAENGGEKGWFTKYNQKVEGQESNIADCHNMRGRFSRYDGETTTKKS